MVRVCFIFYQRLPPMPPIGIFEVALLCLHRACPGGAATDSYMACLFLACSPPGLSRWKQRLAAMLCDIAVNRAPTGTGPVESGNHRERAVAASRRPTGTGPVEAGKRNFKDPHRCGECSEANDAAGLLRTDVQKRDLELCAIL